MIKVGDLWPIIDTLPDRHERPVGAPYTRVSRKGLRYRLDKGIDIAEGRPENSPGKIAFSLHAGSGMSSIPHNELSRIYLGDSDDDEHLDSRAACWRPHRVDCGVFTPAER